MNIRFLALAAVLAASACGQQNTQQAIGEHTIQINGSSTVYPISQEAAKRYMRKNRQADIRVDFVGTGAGFKLFCEGKTDINDASRTINAEEKALCAQNGIQYQELPVAVDTIAFVVNPKNSWVDYLSTDELKTIWAAESEGKITNWQQVRVGFPDAPLKLYGRSSGASGTYDYFTEKVTGQTGSSRKDYTADENEEALAEQIAKEPNALGFFGIGAYHRNWQTLRLLSIDGGSGPVSPSLQTAPTAATARSHARCICMSTKLHLTASAI